MKPETVMGNEEEELVKFQVIEKKPSLWNKPLSKMYKIISEAEVKRNL